MSSPAGAPPRLSLFRDGDDLVVCVTGSWSLRAGLPSTSDLSRFLAASPPPRRARLEADGLARWDTSLVVVLRRIEQACVDRGIPLDLSRAPGAARQFLEVARGADSPLVDSREIGRLNLPDPPPVEGPHAPPLTEAIGLWAMAWGRSLGDKLDFLGSTTIAIARTLLGRTHRLGVGFTLALQEAGVGTLPILAFIAFASGCVLSMLATQQLGKVGATLLAPNLVAIVIFRELGALTTGIALAGRLGASNAAELSAMSAREEIDALRMAGADPFDLLVAPRVLALVLAGPMLVLYANALGLLGSLAVGAGMMDLPAADLLERTRAALNFKHAIAGLVKGVGFGLVVGLASCYYGLRSGNSPGAVGKTVQSSVVASVLGVVLVDAVLTIFFKYVRL